MSKSIIGRSVIITDAQDYTGKIGVITSIDFDHDTAFYFVKFQGDKVARPFLLGEFSYLGYSHEKLEQLKQGYKNAIKELQCSLFILTEAESAGGVLPNKALAEKLLVTGFFKAETVESAELIELECV